jgi:excisionase family DNA binding protein
MFADLDAAIAAASPSERAGLVIQLAALLAQLGAGLAQAPAPEPAEADRNLDVEAAAKRLGLSKRYTYRHADELGAVRLGRRLLFPARGLDRLIARKAAR